MQFLGRRYVRYRTVIDESATGSICMTEVCQRLDTIIRNTTHGEGNTMNQEKYYPKVLRIFRPWGRAITALVALAITLHLSPVYSAENGEKPALEKIQQRGSLTVALYRDYAPFSDVGNDTDPYSNNGKGIDIDLAKALAAKLGVKMSPMWFDASEKMDDDLRKMVWQGTPLGYGPADVLIHAPIDHQYMSMIKQVKFIAPYHRENFAMARNLEKLPTLDSLEPFEKMPLAVEGESMGSDIMCNADSGRYRNNLKFFKSAEGSIDALKSGAVVAVIAQQGELEGGLRDDPRFTIDPPLHPVLKMQKWMLGLAVKAGNDDLAKALETAMSELIADGTVTRIMQQYGVADRQP